MHSNRSPSSSFRASCGIDGARGGWVVASCGSRLPQLELVGEIGPLLVERIEAAGALVDIPIGLPGARYPQRACDVGARALLGPRRSSVFPPPARAALDAATWEEANDLNRAAVGRGLPRQSWGLRRGIREVDALLRRRPRSVGRLRESHPELAFAWLAGGHPLARHKATTEGSTRRWKLLEGRWPGIEGVARDWSRGRTGVALDDVADALALLALAESGASPLRHDSQVDDAGLPMEILVHPDLLDASSPSTP